MTESIGMPPGSTGGLAYDALVMARSAQQTADEAKRDVLSHEEICALRYETINKSLVELKSDNARIWKLFASIGATGFTILMGVLAFLLKAQFDTISEMSKAAQQRAVIQERMDQQPPRIVVERSADSPAMGATVEQKRIP